MKHPLGFGICVTLAAALLVSCSRPAAEPEKVIAKVGGSEITVKDFNGALKRFLPEGKVEERELDELKKNLLNELIEEQLILDYAKKAAITVTEEELSKEAEALEKEYGDGGFKSAVLEKYADMDEWKSEVRRKAIIEKAVKNAVDSSVTDGQAWAYYEKNIKDYDVPDQVRARMIVTVDEKTALEAEKRLLKEKFETVALALSTGPEAKNGGDLGFFSRGDMPLEFEDAAFSLKPGGTSGVIKSPYGYHIFKVEEKTKGKRLDFSEVKDKIIETLKAEKMETAYKDWIASLKSSTTIELTGEIP